MAERRKGAEGRVMRLKRVEKVRGRLGTTMETWSTRTALVREPGLSVQEQGVIAGLFSWIMNVVVGAARNQKVDEH